jgi:Xaa-Pro aminopeptidase
MDRVKALKQKAFEQKSFDGFLITNAANFLYFTGTTGAPCLLIPENGESTVYVYSVNCEQVKAEAKGFKVEMLKRGENALEKASAEVKAHKIQRLALDAISYEGYRTLAKTLRGTAKLKAQNNLVWDLRKVKDEKELELMRKAGELTGKGMKVAYETVRVGMKEYEVAAEIEYEMRKHGSSGTAFETAVSSGTRSAYPHGGCFNREIKQGSIVIVDVGAKYENYCSDITRTIVAGKPTEKQRKLHEIVKLAHDKAFEAIKPKAKASDADAVARKVIADAGYGDYFVHGLGHGVGLEVHEPPALAPTSKDKFAVGNVVTDEPGIYLIGYGGVRIEDSVLAQKRNAEKLTLAQYDLEPEK